jgi:hypothetical protein
MKKFKQVAVLAVSSFATATALACASCGCSLNTDYASQGMGNSEGWTFDLRYDYLNQNQLRSGTGTISPSAAAQTITNTGGNAEVEGFTANHYLNASMDYTNGETWGVSVIVPYIIRDHMTNGVFDGQNGTTTATYSAAGGDNAYTSHASGIGDVKVIGRYFGWSQDRDWGVQFGLKLPTGNYSQLGNTWGVAANGATAVDPGLQLGTGTTDLILGAYKFGHIEATENWGYFTSVMFQGALSASNAPPAIVNAQGGPGNYRPGNSLNLNVGFNYHGFDAWTPTVQFNFIDKQTDGGSMADTFSTGGKLLYVTPGALYPVTDQVKLYSNVQLPLYQNLNGIQLAPKYVASVGVRYSF